MKIYHYSQDGLKIFLGTTQAEKSPLEENVYLLPLSSTFQKVPEYNEFTHIAVFDQQNENWNILEKPLEIVKEPLDETVVINIEKSIIQEPIEEPIAEFIPPQLIKPIIHPKPEEPIKEEKEPIKQIPHYTIDIKYKDTEEDRAKSVFLLTKSDWTQLYDINLTENSKKEWNDYRSKLRNIFKSRKYTMDSINMKIVFPSIERAVFPDEPDTEWTD